MPTATVSASATLDWTANGPNQYNYTITLTDTGSSTVGTFWFSWIPGQDYMNADPTSIGSPAGWSETVTTRGYPGGTGYAIEWTANSSASYLQSGATSSSFTFTSTETPAEMAAGSPFDTTTPTTTAFVYPGPPLTPASDQFVVTVECFRAGTKIRTSNGDVPIETLTPGDRVVTEGGELRAIIWTGRRHVDCRRHPNPERLWPVRIARGALGPSIPAADLWLSQDHAVAFQGRLVPVKYLINGTTITRVAVDEVTWHHLELDSHDVILAEGAPAESWLDTGGRALFDYQAGFGHQAVSDNQAGFVHQAEAPGWYPSGRAGFIREAYSCLPLLLTGPTLAALRRALPMASASNAVAGAA
jgi:hypothetical protein